MIKRIQELNSFKRGDRNIAAIYRGQNLIWPAIQQRELFKGFFNGPFTSFNGTTANRLIKLMPDGSRDLTFNVGNGITTLSPIPTATLSFRTIVDENDMVYVVGGLTEFNNEPALRIVRLFPNGSRDYSFDTTTAVEGTQVSVKDVMFDNQGRIYLGGAIFTYKGTGGLNGLIRVNNDASLDTSFQTTYSLVIKNDSTGPWSLFRTIDDKILLGMSGDSLAPSENLKILSLDGTTLNGYDTEVGTVRKVLQYNNKIYACGSFIINQNQNFIRIGDPAISPFNGIVNSMAIDFDDKIVLVGAFTEYGGDTYNRILRLNPDLSLDTSFNIGAGFNNSVSDIKVDENNKYIVVGSFTQYNGSSYNRAIRLNNDGSIDTSFNIGTGFNSSINNVT